MPNAGKEFENQIRDSIIKAKDIYYYRLKDPAQSFDKSNQSLRFSGNNPFDFIMYKFPNLFTIENKSKAENRLSWTIEKTVKNTDIKSHQILGLLEAYKGGAISGFLFNFRADNLTYFMHIFDFLEFTKSTTKKSININEVIQFGGILIPQILKKVKYTYDIPYLIEECAKRYDYYLEKISEIKDVTHGED